MTKTNDQGSSDVRKIAKPITGRKGKPDCCYSCALPFAHGDDIATLQEEDGTRWLVHVRCLNEDFDKVEP
jgi:hypothetical protein